MLDKWIRGVAWNVKNYVRLTDKDRADWLVVEIEFDEWYNGLSEHDKNMADEQIRILSLALRIFGPGLKITDVDVPF